MLSMQDFREWLSSAEETADAYRRNLVQLTRCQPCRDIERQE